MYSTTEFAVPLVGHRLLFDKVFYSVSDVLWDFDHKAVFIALVRDVASVVITAKEELFAEMNRIATRLGSIKISEDEREKLTIEYHKLRSRWQNQTAESVGGDDK